MTSFACTTRQLAAWNPTFTVQGQVFHKIGWMLRAANCWHKFLQIYFIDNRAEEVRTSLSITNGGLHGDIVEKLRDILHDNNNYIQSLKSAQETLESKNSPELALVIHEDQRRAQEHARRFNRPIANEVAILMPNEPTATRDIVIHQRDGTLKHVSELHPAYDPLQYPLFFPFGTHGYSIYLKSNTGKKLPKCSIIAIILCVEHQTLSFEVDVYSNNSLSICTVKWKLRVSSSAITTEATACWELLQSSRQLISSWFQSSKYGPESCASSHILCRTPLHAPKAAGCNIICKRIWPPRSLYHHNNKPQMIKCRKRLPMIK